MPDHFLEDVSASLAACPRRVRRYFDRLHRRVIRRDGSPQQDELVQQRGRVADPLVILVVEILTTDFSLSRATAAQLGLGFVYGVAISALHLPLGHRTRLRTVLALAGVLPVAVYLFPNGPTLHVIPMIIISAAAGTEIQHRFCFRSRDRTVDSVLRPQSSVECLLVAWLIAVGGNAKDVSHFVQACVVLFLDVLSSSMATRSLTRFFLRVVLVTVVLACLVQQCLPSSTPKNLDRRGEVAGSSQRQNGWPRAEILTVVGFFVTPAMAHLYKDIREVLGPRLYCWLLNRLRAVEQRQEEEGEEEEENHAPNEVFPGDHELPLWVGREEARELRAEVEQGVN